MHLFFDTETTGLPDFRAPSDAPHQPHLVQLAALLTEADGTERGSLSLIIKPEGWEIPAEAAAIHGITTEVATRCGVPLVVAVSSWCALCLNGTAIVAHNISFDLKILRTACLRVGLPRESIETDPRSHYCTMRKATPIVNLPPTAKMLAAGFRRPKAPTLTECVRHFFGEGVAGAHDAMVDVRACARVYFRLREMELEPVS